MDAVAPAFRLAAGDPAAVLAAAWAAGEVARQHADASEAARRLAPPVVAALRDAGLMRLCVPDAYGGPEVDPMTMVAAVAAVAEADGAAGWCAMIASTTSSMALFLEPDVARVVFGDPRSISGGAFAPNGVGRAVDGGYEVTGRWQWGSGTQHCTWITGGTLTDDGGFHLMFLPAAEVTIHDTWDSGINVAYQDGGVNPGRLAGRVEHHAFAFPKHC